MSQNPNAPWTQTADKRFWAYYVEPETVPLPCVLCGRAPASGEPVLETLQGEAHLLCVACVNTANSGFLDLSMKAHDDGPSAGPEAPPW